MVAPNKCMGSVFWAAEWISQVFEDLVYLLSPLLIIPLPSPVSWMAVRHLQPTLILTCIFWQVCIINGFRVVPFLAWAHFCLCLIYLPFSEVLHNTAVVPDIPNWHAPAAALIGLSSETYTHLKQWRVPWPIFSPTWAWVPPIFIAVIFSVMVHSPW